ncbi:MAG: hypothetical protein ABW128_14270 [Rhizorhabdus sp.]
MPFDAIGNGRKSPARRGGFATFWRDPVMRIDAGVGLFWRDGRAMPRKRRSAIHPGYCRVCYAGKPRSCRCGFESTAKAAENCHLLDRCGGPILGRSAFGKTGMLLISLYILIAVKKADVVGVISGQISGRKWRISAIIGKIGVSPRAILLLAARRAFQLPSPLSMLSVILFPASPAGFLRLNQCSAGATEKPGSAGAGCAFGGRLRDTD